MKPKWINDVDNELKRDDFYGQMFRDGIFSILDKINVLLRRAAYSTDDEVLHDDILREIKASDIRGIVDSSNSDSSDTDVH